MGDFNTGRATPASAASAMAAVAAASARSGATSRSGGGGTSRGTGETSRGSSAPRTPGPREVRDAGKAAAKAAKGVADTYEGSARPPGAASAVRTNGRTHTGVSGQPGRTDLHPQVQKALSNVPAEQRSRSHGGCAEPKAISNALYSGTDPRGGSIAAVRIGSNGNGAPHGEVIRPCTSCASVIDQFQMNPVMPAK